MVQEKLIRLRKVYNVTQKELAEYLKITDRTYQNKESGKTAFSSDQMFALAMYFKKPIEDIFLPSTHQNGEKVNKEVNRKHIV